MGRMVARGTDIDRVIQRVITRSAASGAGGVVVSAFSAAGIPLLRKSRVC